MNKLELVKSSLASHIGEEKIKIFSPNRYLVDSGLILYNNYDVLPVNLVEVDDKVYFADYGQTLEAFDINFDNLSTAFQEKLTRILKENGIEFDGQSLLKETDNQHAFLDYNIFVKTIIIIEHINERWCHLSFLILFKYLLFLSKVVKIHIYNPDVYE